MIRSQTLGVSTGSASYSFEPSMGVFNDSSLLAADWAIAEAERLGLRLIVPLTDNGKHYPGGKRDFCEWCGLPNRHDDDPLFYSDPCVVGAFKDFIAHRLNHINPFTGRAAKDEPSIAIWETGNELNATANWTSEIARLIKSIDKNHLVMDGNYGVKEDHLSLADVDLYSDHYYPPNANRLAESAQQCKAYGKVFSAGEFGWSNEDKLNALLSACKLAPACGQAAPWSFFPHADDHGFVQHGDGFTFHYPGWGSDSEKHLVREMRDFAAEVGNSGLDPNNPIIVEAAPALTKLTADVVSWRGAALAAWYEVQVAALMPASGNASWRNLLNGSSLVTDDGTPWNVTKVGSGPLRIGEWVRMRGVGLVGTANGTSTAGPWSSPKQVQI
jgi:hypothetical protein